MMAFAIIGGIIQGIGQIQALQAQAAAADYEAKVNDVNAQTARMQASVDAKAKRREKVRALGTMQNQFGATGLGVAGTALDVMTDSFLEYTMDEKLIVYQGEMRATDFENRATLKRMEAKSARRAIPIAFASSAIGGVGKALDLSGRAGSY